MLPIVITTINKIIRLLLNTVVSHLCFSPKHVNQNMFCSLRSVVFSLKIITSRYLQNLVNTDYLFMAGPMRRRGAPSKPMSSASNTNQQLFVTSYILSNIEEYMYMTFVTFVHTFTPLEFNPLKHGASL